MRLASVLILGLFVFGCSMSSALHGQESTVLTPDVLQPGSPSPSWQVFTISQDMGSNILGIITGPDKNLWFTDSPSSIGRVTTDGTVTIFNLPTPMSYPITFARGPNSTLWFTEESPRIGVTTMSGVVTEYTNPLPNSRSWFIAQGSDGNFWFTEDNSVFPGGVIGRIRPNGHFMSYLFPPTSDAGLYGLVRGPDRNIWFTEPHARKIGRVTPSGQFTEFGPTKGGPEEITTGPDGNLWFTDASSDPSYIGKITPSGTITEYALHGSNLGVASITVGSDRALWFTEITANALGRIDTMGNSSIFFLPFSRGPQPYFITSGPDNNLWFSVGGYRVGVYILLKMIVVPSAITFTGVGQMQTLTVHETRYHGSWSASSSNGAVATVAPGSSSNIFVVTAVGSGSATISVADTKHND